MNDETTPNDNSDRLLVEYERAFNLAMHDDILLQSRNASFLTVNTILFASVAAIMTAEKVLGDAPLAISVLSILGLVVSAAWFLLQVRHGEVLRFRRYFLRHLEPKLRLSLYTHAERALNRHERLSYAGLEDTFHLNRWARYRASVVERTLSIMLFSAWVGVLWDASIM